MHLIQLLLPLYDNDQQRLPTSRFTQVKAELAEKFGGLTAYTRTPAEGFWKPDEASAHRDEIVVYEVMVQELEAAWWRRYRQSLESRFRQQSVIVRAQEIELL